MLIITATILTMTTPTGEITPHYPMFPPHLPVEEGSLSPEGSLIYLGVFRILLGIGVGGDYPMSASITSDRANLRKRGTLLAYIFSNQGWGSFFGSLVTLIVLAAYRGVMENGGQTSKTDGGKLFFHQAMVPGLALVIFSLAHRGRCIARPCLWNTLPAPHPSRIHAIHRLTKAPE